MFQDLNDKMDIISELDFAGQKADIWLITVNGTQIGAVVIKKPGGDGLDNTYLL